MPDNHYTHPRLAALYDLDSPWSTDTEFYLKLAGSRACRVLDLGCGTGTLCLGLAAAGHAVVGVDPAAAMLVVARDKPNARAVTWVQATAQDYVLPNQFDFMTMTGRAFQCLESDAQILATLRNAKQHLASDGRIAFESRNPAIDWDREWARTSTWSLTDHTVRQERSDLAIDGEFISFQHKFTFPDETLVSASRLRFLSRTNIENLLQQAGFVVTQLYGDWNGEPFVPEQSREMIFVAQASVLAT